MKAYYGEELLLENEAAKKIYEEIKNLPIIDYHCHLDEMAIIIVIGCAETGRGGMPDRVNRSGFFYA